MRNNLTAAIFAVITVACSQPRTDARAKTSVNPHSQAVTIDSIYWSDGDSGRINGSLKFRLNDIDAPETGGVGAAIGGAKCETERAKGFESKAWVVAFTRDTELIITRTHGQDHYERLIIDLASNGQDVGQMGLKSGHYQAWPHDGKKALSERPMWCTLNEKND